MSLSNFRYGAWGQPKPYKPELRNHNFTPETPNPKPSTLVRTSFVFSSRKFKSVGVSGFGGFCPGVDRVLARLRC